MIESSESERQVVSTAPKLGRLRFDPHTGRCAFERALGAKQHSTRSEAYAAANDLGAPGSARQGRDLRQGRGLDPRVHEIARGLGRCVDDLSHTSHKRPQTVGGVTYPASLDSHPSMPSLRIRDPEKNPITGCLPSQVARSRLDIDDAQHTPANVRAQEFGGRRLEDALWLQGWCARTAIIGSNTHERISSHALFSRFFIHAYRSRAPRRPWQDPLLADTLRHGGGPRPIARKVQLAVVRGSLASSSKTSLSRSPSAAELDALLLRRSRARGRGGQLGAWAEKVQPKWSVLFAAGSSGAVSMKPTG